MLVATITVLGVNSSVVDTIDRMLKAKQHEAESSNSTSIGLFVRSTKVSQGEHNIMPVSSLSRLLFDLTDWTRFNRRNFVPPVNVKGFLWRKRCASYADSVWAEAIVKKKKKDVNCEIPVFSSKSFIQTYCECVGGCCSTSSIITVHVMQWQSNRNFWSVSRVSITRIKWWR